MSKYFKAWPIFALLFAFLLAPPASAADPLNIDLSSLEEQQGRLSATVRVSGSDGRPIVGLGTPNFSASLNDTKVNISDLLSPSVARQPAHVVLVVDVSGSMAGNPINQARIAMQDFVRGLDPIDRVAIVSFGTSVNDVQDFTADRSVLNQAIARLTAMGETALYDGVLQGLHKISEAPAGRRMVVLLSDGTASGNFGLRPDTIEAAAATGVGVFAVGLGNGIDRPYLTELADASGGTFLPAPSPAVLRQAYADLANAFRAQYTVVIAVPSTFDRTVPALLRLQVTLRADSAVLERELGPLEGANVPPFELKVGGVSAGQKISEPALLALKPALPPEIGLASISYSLNGQELFATSQEPFDYSLDTGPLPVGNHIIKVSATDVRGRSGEAQVAFTILAPPQSGGMNPQVIMGVLLLALAGGLVFLLLKKRKSQLQGVLGRVRPFARRSDEPMLTPIDGWPMPSPTPVPVPVPEDRVLGRVVVMDEAAVRAGNLDSIQEYEIRSHPLVLGTGDDADIKLIDPEGRIAAEEARLWVQRGRLVYHKLTTLSAMATEGVTSGWEFLESGEELRLGSYRILFEEYAEERATQEDDGDGHEALPPVDQPAPALKPMQEHGMSLSDLWTRVTEEAQLTQRQD